LVRLWVQLDIEEPVLGEQGDQRLPVPAMIENANVDVVVGRERTSLAHQAERRAGGEEPRDAGVAQSPMQVLDRGPRVAAIERGEASTSEVELTTGRPASQPKLDGPAVQVPGGVHLACSGS